MLTRTPNLSESCCYIRRYEKPLNRRMQFFLLKLILIHTYIQRTKLSSWILSVLLKSCDTIHSHIFCTPCRAAGSHVCSLYEVSMFSVLFSFAYMSQYKLNVLLTWLSWLLCFEWQSERSFDKWLTTCACFVCLHCYGRTIRSLLHFVTKQPKIFCIVFLSSSKNRNISCCNRDVILQGECM
jgi:hypothetical protein